MKLAFAPLLMRELKSTEIDFDQDFGWYLVVETKNLKRGRRTSKAFPNNIGCSCFRHFNCHCWLRSIGSTSRNVVKIRCGKNYFFE
jgi:hypothetical protein